jgi:hypothetical protein
MGKPLVALMSLQEGSIVAQRTLLENPGPEPCVPLRIGSLALQDETLYVEIE